MAEEIVLSFGGKLPSNWTLPDCIGIALGGQSLGRDQIPMATTAVELEAEFVLLATFFPSGGSPKN